MYADNTAISLLYLSDLLVRLSELLSNNLRNPKNDLAVPLLRIKTARNHLHIMELVPGKA